MSVLLASSVVDWDALWKILLVGLLAGAGVVVAFGLLLVARARYAEAGESAATRAGYLVIGMLGAAFCAITLIAGFIAMTTK